MKVGTERSTSRATLGVKYGWPRRRAPITWITSLPASDFKMSRRAPSFNNFLIKLADSPTVSTSS